MLKKESVMTMMLKKDCKKRYTSSHRCPRFICWGKTFYRRSVLNQHYKSCQHQRNTLIAPFLDDGDEDFVDEKIGKCKDGEDYVIVFVPRGACRDIICRDCRKKYTSTHRCPRYICCGTTFYGRWERNRHYKSRKQQQQNVNM